MKRPGRLIFGAALLLALLSGGCKDDGRRCEESDGEWIEGVCWPALTSRDCPAGTSPRVGAGGCVPVGHGARGCPLGFEPGADGWGCEPRRASACQPGWRPVLGQSSCIPIDDCQRPFPPAAATIFVDDDFGPGELDATHFASLVDAVAAAPAGAHLAIESGVYEGLVILERPITLEGRCLFQTLMGNLVSSYSLVVEPGVTASLSHVAFGNYTGGIQVRAGATLEASHLYLEQVGSVGMLADGAGAVIRAREVVIRDTLAESGTQENGVPILATGGGTISVSESLLTGWYQGAGVATGAGSRVAFDRVITERGSPGPANSAFGMLADLGGRLDARSTVFHHTGRAGFHLSGPGSLLIAEDVVVLDAAGSPTGGAAGRALDVQDGAEAQISGFTFVSGADTAILVTGGKAFLDHGLIRGLTTADRFSELNTGAAVIDGGELALHQSVLLDTAGDALVVAGVGSGAGQSSLLVARESLISGAHLDSRGNLGVGLAVVDGATARTEQLSIRDTSWVGVQVAGPGSFLEATGLAVIGTRSVSVDQRGLGIVVYDGARLLLRDSRLRDTDGIGLTVGQDSASSATGGSGGVIGTIIEGNGLGANTQGPVALEVVEALPEPLPADRLVISADTLFRENAVRTASERVALPPPPPPFSP